VSFRIFKEVDGKKFYWQYGVPAGWTEDRNEGRQYNMEASANQALTRILQRTDGTGAAVEKSNG
jgi:hypothetical protein